MMLLAVTALAAVLTAGDVHANIRLSPTLVGPATLRVILHDKTGAPIDNATIAAHVDMVSMEMEPGFKSLVHSSHGIYARSIRLTMPGHYHVELLVKRPGHKNETLDAPVFIDIP